MNYKFEIEPIAAPRMTQKDKFSPSKAASKYFAYRNELGLMARIQGLNNLPEKIESITFLLPVPASWSLRKQRLYQGEPHQGKPDLDNLLKGFMDCFGEDSHIHSIGKLSKIWSDQGCIRIEFADHEPAKTQSQQCTIYGE